MQRFLDAILLGRAQYPPLTRQPLRADFARDSLSQGVGTPRLEMRSSQSDSAPVSRG
jgi:hypothetical protein